MYRFMHHVSSAWHRLYWALMLVGSGIFVLLYAFEKFFSKGTHLPAFIGSITLAVAILALIQIIYSVSLFWFISKRDDAMANFGGGMLFLLVILDGLVGSNFTTAGIPFIAAWYLLSAFTGIFSLAISIGSIFMTIAFVLARSNFQASHSSDITIALIIGNIVLSIGGYLVWKNKYDDTQYNTLDQLSSSLSSNVQQSRIIIESIADGLIVTNIEGKISMMNPAAAAMTEWEVSEALGLDASLVIKLHNENGENIDPSEDPFTVSFKEKQHINQIVEITGRNNNKRPISLTVSPILAPKTGVVLGVVAVMRDVSFQKAEEKKRDDFISTAAHEMRTPVAAIEGYLALALNDKVSTIDARARSYLDKAHASTQHLGMLFQDLLTSSKAEDGRLSNHPAVVEMSAFLEQLTDDLKFTAEKKGLFVEFTIGSSDEAIDATSSKDVSTQHMVKPLYYVIVDPDRIREVLTNLFDNACKYTDQGKISIGLTGNNELVQLYVRDTGAGIPKDDIPHLFQKFYRVDSSATRTVGGTGLGLFICRKIVELYHGRIWVESEPEKGSTFFINLPRITTEKAMELQNVAANPTTNTTSQQVVS